MAKRVALLIDGGFLRVQVKNAKLTYDPDCIEKVARACLAPDEEFFRIFYYDSPPYSGTVTLPVSGNPHTYAPNAGWLKVLANKELFAVRLGILKFRGFKPRQTPIGHTPTDADFSADFEQKGVDMRIDRPIRTNACRRPDHPHDQRYGLYPRHEIRPQGRAANGSHGAAGSQVHPGTPASYRLS
jgi:hypothetical protein